jgi:hypothetical protein
MKSDDALIYAGIALVGYSLLKSEFGQKPLTREQTIAHIEAAGGDVRKGSLGTFWAVPGGSVSLDQTFTPNFAQKVLVGLDAFVPGTWLTRKVYGV